MTTAHREHEDGVLGRLRQALQALALPAERQLRLLPGFVPEVDELALSFEHWLEVARAEAELRLTDAQRDALGTVERLLDGMSGQENAFLWTRRAMREKESWARLRQAAAAALAAFGWDLEAPPGRLFEYIEW
jgi:hypothetical protein